MRSLRSLTFLRHHRLNHVRHSSSDDMNDNGGGNVHDVINPLRRDISWDIVDEMDNARSRTDHFRERTTRRR